VKIKILKKIYPFGKIIKYRKFIVLGILLVGLSCKVEDIPVSNTTPIKHNLLSVQKINNDNLNIKIPKLSAVENDKLIKQYYKSGCLFDEKGEYLKAQEQFNLAVKYILIENSDKAITDSTSTIYEDMLESIFDAESDWYGFDKYDGTNKENVLLDEAPLQLTAKDVEKEKELVEKAVVTYNIPVVYNKQVLSMVKSYSTRLKPVIQKTMERSFKYIERFKEIFREEGVPDDLAYLPIIESGYRTHALSRAKAKGIWQFMRGTARLEGLKVNWWVDERCDPEMATRAAAKHLKRLHQMFGDWYLALAAYNAGPGKINRAIRKTKSRDFWKIAKKRWVLRRETKNYVPAFLAALIIAKNPKEYGFTNLQPVLRQDVDVVFLDSCTDLAVVAKLTKSSVSTLQKLNPHLKRLTTPPNEKKFKLYIPKGTKEKFLAEFKKLPKEKRVTIRYHKIKQGQTLSQIARKYKTSVSAIKRANGIRGTMIRAGKTIVIPIGKGKDIYFPKNYTVKKVRLRYKTGTKLTHKVRRGDTLFAIAVKYRTDTKSICKWNNLTSDFLKPGQKLILYYNKSVVKKQKNKKKTKKIIPEGYYLVKQGDSLYSIARAFSVDVNTIKKINGKSSNIIRPGELIKVVN
jgi:membrane-bound lytic murein transglycosylase D